MVLFVITFMITQLLFLGSDYWLSLWTHAEEMRYLRSTSFHESNLTKSAFIDTIESSPIHLNSTEDTNTISEWIQNIDTTTGVFVFSLLTGGLFLFTMIRTTHFFLICMASSVKLHTKMFGSIIRAQLVFFDRNPVGKRFI